MIPGTLLSKNEVNPTMRKTENLSECEVVGKAPENAEKLWFVVGAFYAPQITDSSNRLQNLTAVSVELQYSPIS